MRKKFLSSAICFRRNYEGQAGYAALLSVIILGTFLTTVTMSLSTAVAFSLSNTLARETKAQSLASAKACADRALLYYALDRSYRGSETIENIPCVLKPLTVTGTEITIVSSATINEATSTVQTIAAEASLSLVSQHEIIN